MTHTSPMEIAPQEDGTFAGLHDDYVIRTAFQPIFRFEGGRLVPVACEALARVSRGSTPVLFDAWFNAIGIDTFLTIEPELRRLHVRNAHHIPAAQRRLFLNFDPRICENPAIFHIALRDLGAELRAADISPSDVLCEITEAETTNADALTHFAYELRARGYLIAVDDFGAKASRLARVAALAPDVVKFDGKLVRRLLATRTGTGTLRALVAKFQSDGIQSVLEGLEALMEVGLAEETGAAMVQGYVLAAPRLAGPDLPAWLAQYAPPEVDSGTRLVKQFR